eukprot:TRINITY_DN26268_c0_g1_i1.p1 TRINITY_DN26268_c0_g1~~TRINITY_DN26268_c0_g1_i1.p1  ORF type:complete len:303 (+),score=19.28 TRINITY_DN26268_c0_g1_i1:90-998(+)
MGRECLSGPRRRIEALIASAEPGNPATVALRSVLGSGEARLLQVCCAFAWGRNDQCWEPGNARDFDAYSVCCFEDLRELVEKPEPRWLTAELDADFVPWSGKRLTTRDMDGAEAMWGHVFCRFRVLEGVLHTCDPERVEKLKDGSGSEMYGQYETMKLVVQVLLSNGLLPDKLDFFVSPHIYEFVDTVVPVLAKARTVWTQGPIRVPSYELFGPWIDQTRQKMEDNFVHWEDRDPVLLWRGGLRSFNSCPCEGPSRRAWPVRWRRYNFSEYLADDDVPGKSCSCHAESICDEADSVSSRTEH